MTYDTAGGYLQVLDLHQTIHQYMPVDWKDKASIKSFREACDAYAKAYNRLSWADQGLVSELISKNKWTGSV
jgi:hypothetical protein